MFELDLSFVVQSDTAHMLIAFSILTVAAIIWTKTRAMKYKERRNYFKRLNSGGGLNYDSEKSTQLEFDF